jgi:VWFA-related protein
MDTQKYGSPRACYSDSANATLREASMRRTVAVALGVLLAGSTIGFAQQPAQPPATFRAGTTLVDFTIVAVDAKGNPVTDLRRDEIVILEDDQSREVAFFQFEGAARPGDSGAAASAAATLPAGTFSNQPRYAARPPRNLIAIVLDLINTSIPQQAELQTHLLHNLKQLPADAHVGLYILSEQAVAIHDFTQDAESLRTRLEKGAASVQTTLNTSARDIQGMLKAARAEHAESLAAMAQARARAEGDLNQQITRTRRRLTLQALQSVGQHLAGTPGRKSIVWVSHGFPLTDAYGTYTSQVSDASQQLATQNVAVYPVEAGGVGGTSLGIDDQTFGSTRGQRSGQSTGATTFGNLGSAQVRGRTQGTNELMAAITGGRVTRNSNDLTDGLRLAADDLRGTYSLGFYSVTDPDHRWHPLQVRVSRPGVTVRHRQGYFSASTRVNQTQEWPQDQWNDLAFRPLISTALRIDARPTLSAATLKVDLDVAIDDLQFRQTDRGLRADLDIALVERTAAGPTNVRVQSASVEISSGAEPAVVPVSAQFTLNPQTASVRVIVRDKASGRIGSLDLPLDKMQRQ